MPDVSLQATALSGAARLDLLLWLGCEAVRVLLVQLLPDLGRRCMSSLESLLESRVWAASNTAA